MSLFSTTTNSVEKIVKTGSNTLLGYLEGMETNAKSTSNNLFGSLNNYSEVLYNKSAQSKIESRHELEASKSAENKEMSKAIYLAGKRNELQNKELENLEDSIKIGNKSAELRESVKDSIRSTGMLDYDAIRAEALQELIAEEKARMKEEILAGANVGKVV